MAADIRAGRAYVELGSKDSGFSKGLRNMQKRFQAFGAGLRNVGIKLFSGGATALGALSGAAVAYGQMGAHAERSSEKTGLSVEATSTLGYAAKSTGVESETLEKSIGAMSKTLAEASTGSKEAQESLARLGLTMADLNGLSQEDRFKKIADSLSNVQDKGAQIDLAKSIFGKGGQELLPLIDQGAAGINKLQQHARDLGLEMSGKDAEGALVFSEKLDDLWQVMQMLVFKIGAGVAPALQQMVDIGTRLAVGVGDWVNQHRKLVEILFLVAAGVTVVGALFVGLGIAISVVGTVLGGLATAFTVLGGVIAAIVSPIGLVIVGIVAAAGAFLYFSGVGTTIGNAIVGVFQRIWGAIQFVFQNTSSLSGAWAATLAEGSFFVQDAWLTTKGFFHGLWSGIKGEAIQVWDDIVGGIAKSILWLTDVFESAWSRTMHMWRELTNKTADVVSGIFLHEANASTDAQLAQIDQQEKAGQISHRQAMQQRTSVLQTNATYANGIKYNGNQGDQQTDADFQKRIELTKQQYEEQRKALDGLQAQQKSNDAQATKDDKARYAQQIKDAQAAIDKARQAYETALKQQHDASGDRSLADQAKSIFGSIIPPATPAIPDALHPDALNSGMDAALKAGGGAAGTFNASSIAGMFGSGDNTDRHLNTIATETTKASGLLQSIANTFKGAQPMRHS